MAAEAASFAPDPAPTSSATTLTVPSDRIVTVEHPCIIRDVDKGIATLGGPHHLEQILKDKPNSLPLTAALRAHDPFARRLQAQKWDVNHVLLRVVLPKKTGRKRKRGSNDPFEFHNDSRVSNTGDNDHDCTLPLQANELLAKLRAAGNDIDIEAVGPVRSSHRFRSLPDFQLVDQDAPIMQHLQEKLLHPTLESVKSFQPLSTQPTPLVGPPQFASYTQQLYYNYSQSRGTTTVTDAQGNTTSVNAMAPRRRVQIGLPATVSTIPTSPDPSLPPLSTLSPPLLSAITDLTALLTTRPIITRRAALNLAPQVPESFFGEAMQYCAYPFRSGPWRDTWVRFGLDPRTSPSYRQYQTLVFKLLSRKEAKQSLATGGSRWARAAQLARGPPPSTVLARAPSDTHVFTGAALADTKTWQLCDVADPLLARLVAALPLRETPDVAACGWLTDEGLVLLRSVMRDKIDAVLEGAVAGTWDRVWERVVDAGLLALEREPGTEVPVDVEGLSVEEKRRGNGVLRGVKGVMKIEGVGRWGKRKGGAEERMGSEDEDDEDGALADLEALEHADVGDGESGPEEQGEGESE